MMISETLAFRSLHGSESTGFIRITQRLTMIISEIKFREITVQMLFAAMLIYAAHTALEDAEIAFR